MQEYPLIDVMPAKNGYRKDAMTHISSNPIMTSPAILPIVIPDTYSKKEISEICFFPNNSCHND